MSTSAQPRPPQVTLAGWMIIVGSVLVVGSVFELIGGLRSLETREAIEAFLAEPPGDTLGLGVESVMEVLRVAAMVTAGCATAAAVLGWHALQRNRGARIGLTVLAVPLFLAGIVTGGFMSSLVAAASLLLWLQPARDWFNGKPYTPPVKGGSAAAPWPPDRADPTQSPAQPSSPPPTYPPAQPPTYPPADPPTGDDQPRPVEGFGERPTWVPAEGGGQGAQVHGQVPAPTRRPENVLVAAIITWVFAGFTLLSSIASMALLAGAPGDVMAELERQQPELAEQGVTEEMLVSTTYAVGSVVVLWSLAAVVAAVFLLRRKAWALKLLTALAGLSALACFGGSLATLVLALPALGSAAVFFLLRRPEVKAWFAGAPGVRP